MQMKMCYKEVGVVLGKKGKLQKDKKSLGNIIEAIREIMNPFDDTTDEKYSFNVSTDKAALEDIVDFLLNVKAVGNQQKLKILFQRAV